MSYVDAGYVIALVALALYSLTLIARRRRLERAAGRCAESVPDTVAVRDLPAPDAGR